MPATVTAIAAQKGGTGKTALAASLVPQWAYAAHRTLAIDLDQQANLTYAFAIRPDRLAATIVDVLAPRAPVAMSDAVVSDVHRVAGLDLVPCDERAEALDIQLRSEAMGVYRLREALEPLLDRYDRIFMDCPPNVGELTMSALLAADEVICPIKLSDTNAVRGLNRLYATIEKINRRGANVAFKALVGLDYDERELAHQLNLDALRKLAKRYEISMAATLLRKRASWPKAATQDVPLILFDERDSSTRDAQNDVRCLAHELWPKVNFLYPSEITTDRRLRSGREQVAA